jgi:hypothetical protein
MQLASIVAKNQVKDKYIGQKEEAHKESREKKRGEIKRRSMNALAPPAPRRPPFV